MKITNTQVRTIKDRGALIGTATVTFDDEFVVHDITVINGRKGKFISMPSRKLNNDKYIDIVHPIKTEVRKMIQDAVLEAYDKRVQEEEAADNNETN